MVSILKLIDNYVIWLEEAGLSFSIKAYEDIETKEKYFCRDNNSNSSHYLDVTGKSKYNTYLGKTLEEAISKLREAY